MASLNEPLLISSSKSLVAGVSLWRFGIKKWLSLLNLVRVGIHQHIKQICEMVLLHMHCVVRVMTNSLVGSRTVIKNIFLWKLSAQALLIIGSQSKNWRSKKIFISGWDLNHSPSCQLGLSFVSIFGLHIWHLHNLALMSLNYHFCP
jgi:hypothetical protein